MSRLAVINCDHPARDPDGSVIGTCSQSTFANIPTDAERKALAQGWQLDPDRCPHHSRTKPTPRLPPV